MECGDEVRCVGDVGSGFPRVLVGAVSIPFDQILQLSTGEAAVEDVFDFVFFFAIHDDWVGRWRFSETIVPIWQQPVDMKNGVELKPTWKFELEIQVADSFENLKRSKLTRS